MVMAQEWDLKALGNWTAFRENNNAGADSDFTDATDLNQSRTHNAANEITGISETGGQVAWADPSHDIKGNITSYAKPSSMTSSYTCTYDAWNRLVRIVDFDPVADYVYDGLGRRITKKTYDVNGNLDKTRQFFYTNQWQDIEERVDQRTNDLERQYVWGIGYVDELILRDRDTADDTTLDQRHYALQDANYSVTCIVDTAGDAAERYLYTPYGTRSVTDGSFANPSANGSYDWNIGHQGLMHDNESSLVYNRNRMLHPALGRFMQRDPLGYVDGMSLYELTRSTPTIARDPSGLATIQWKRCAYIPAYDNCMKAADGTYLLNVDIAQRSRDQCLADLQTVYNVCIARCLGMHWTLEVCCRMACDFNWGIASKGCYAAYAGLMGYADLNYQRDKKICASKHSTYVTGANTSCPPGTRQIDSGTWTDLTSPKD
jgi:RHS repeat-associated protein